MYLEIAEAREGRPSQPASLVGIPLGYFCSGVQRQGSPRGAGSENLKSSTSHQPRQMSIGDSVNNSKDNLSDFVSAELEQSERLGGFGRSGKPS